MPPVFACVLQHLEEDSAEGGINEIAQQLAFSDLILLNKTDLVDKQQMEHVRQAVRRINQSAQLHECQLNQEGGRPPLSLLLDNNSFSVNKALKVDPEFLHSDSGSDLSDDSDLSDSDDSSDAEGAAEAGVAAAAADGGVDDIPSQRKAAAAADAAAAPASGAAAAAEAEGSSAQACCGQKQQTEAAEADSSQLTSTTAVHSGGHKRKAHPPGTCTTHGFGAHYYKVRQELDANDGCCSLLFQPHCLAQSTCLGDLLTASRGTAANLWRCSSTRVEMLSAVIQEGMAGNGAIAQQCNAQLTRGASPHA